MLHNKPSKLTWYEWNRVRDIAFDMLNGRRMPPVLGPRKGLVLRSAAALVCRWEREHVAAHLTAEG